MLGCRPVDEELAALLREFRSPSDNETRMFYEVVIAPGYTPEGLAKLKGKSKTLRILEAKPRAPEGQSLRQVAGGTALPLPFPFTVFLCHCCPRSLPPPFMVSLLCLTPRSPCCQLYPVPSAFSCLCIFPAYKAPYTHGMASSQGYIHRRALIGLWVLHLLGMMLQIQHSLWHACNVKLDKKI